MAVHAVLGLRPHLDGVEAVVADIGERIGDELDLVAVVPRVVAGGGVGSTGEEEIGEAGRLHAEERLRTVGPVVIEGEAVPSPDPIRSRAPVPKSNPVAHTMMSNSSKPSVVSMPRPVTRTIGVCLRSTRETLGSLNISK